MTTIKYRFETDKQTFEGEHITKLNLKPMIKNGQLIYPKTTAQANIYSDLQRKI